MDGNNTLNVLQRLFVQTNPSSQTLQTTYGCANGLHLPPWAKDGVDFVNIHRYALESEYVSAHLHEWIDLYFGPKQRFVSAVNENEDGWCSLNLESESDPSLSMMPIQIFRRPHPPRRLLSGDDEVLIFPIASPMLGASTCTITEKPRHIYCYGSHQIATKPILYLTYFQTSVDKGRLISIDSTRCYGNHAFEALAPDTFSPYELSVNEHLSGSTKGSGGFSSYLRGSSIKVNGKLGCAYAASVGANATVHSRDSLKTGTKGRRSSYLEEERSHRNQNWQSSDKSYQDSNCFSCQLFCAIPSSELIISCGHWDGTIKVTDMNTGKVVFTSAMKSRNIVTCIAVDIDYDCYWLIGGADDGIVTIWKCVVVGLAFQCQSTYHLTAQTTSILCVAISSELSVGVSGSKDGNIFVHNIRDGSLCYKIAPQISTDLVSGNALQPSINMVLVSKEGYILSYSIGECRLSTYTMNGELSQTINTRERIFALCLSTDGRVIVTGGEGGLVVLRWVYNLKLADSFDRKGLDCVMDGSEEEWNIQPFPSAIRSLCFTPNERHLVVGLESGVVRVLSQVFRNNVIIHIDD